MTSRIRSPKDFWAGLLYVGFGLAAIVIGRDYELGTALRMGPAYFPTALGALLTLIGSISLLRAFLQPGESIGHMAIRPLVLITIGILLFGFLARGAGLIVVIPILVVISACASVQFRWLASILLAIGMTLFCVLVFNKGLGVPLPIVGSWFGA